MYVDADTHVDETDETWSYIPKSEDDISPKTIRFEDDQLPAWMGRGGATKSGSNRFWFIDGLLFPRRIRNDEETGTTLGTRELTNVPLRLEHMDQLKVDVQVIYPTLFISEVTRRPELEIVLARAYNRWLSERCADSGGRLRWVAVIPFGSPPDDVIAEVRYAKEQGAVGLFKRAVQTGRALSDPIFFPVYKEAEELDLPICVHQSNEWEPINRALSPVRLGSFDSLQVPRSFLAIAAQRVPEKFPNLRFGFLEAASAWLPHIMDLSGATARGTTLSEMNCYVANFVNEDIPYLSKTLGGDDNFMIGSDYCHSDIAAVKDMHERITSRPDLNEKTVLKITNDNVRRFYGI